jgi:hypothetical protein
MGDERKDAGTGGLVDLMRKDQNLQEEALKRARDYCGKSGVTKIIDGINRERDSRQKIDGAAIPEEGKVVYYIDLSGGSVDHRSRIDIEVNSKGTIEIVGDWWLGSSIIEEKKWVKDPELINKALVKAFSHPRELGRDLQGEI